VQKNQKEISKDTEIDQSFDRLWPFIKCLSREELNRLLTAITNELAARSAAIVAKRIFGEDKCPTK
jgi:hypothetical protein